MSDQQTFTTDEVTISVWVNYRTGEVGYEDDRYYPVLVDPDTARKNADAIEQDARESEMFDPPLPALVDEIRRAADEAEQVSGDD